MFLTPLRRKVLYHIKPKEKNALDYFDQGIAAYNSKKYSVFLKNLQKAVKLAPNNPNFLYALARAHASLGEKNEAMVCLDKVVNMGFYFNSPNSDFDESEKGDFDCIQDAAEYRAILEKIEKANKTINKSEIALVIPEKDLMPESIAYDPVEQAFYLGSFYKRKVIKINAAGKKEDFIREKQDGLWSVTGIKVDAKRRILWVNSCVHSKMKDGNTSILGLTGVFKYRLSDGQLINKYLLDERPLLHLFNDLVVNSQGDVFITDSLFSGVYVITQKKNNLELFFKKKEQFSKPNGIAISEDEKYLYVSHAEGISIINSGTGAYSGLSHPENLSITQIDGLYFYQNSLLAIQGNYRPARVIRLYLDNSLKRIERAEIIEAGNPIFMLPTTGVLVEDLFYYIANSQLPLYSEGSMMTPLENLNEIVILVSRLK